MLRSLEIQNFKGIRQGKLDELAQVNILVGRNNSGKSTILDALILLRSAVVGRDYLDTLGVEQIIKRRVDRGTVDYRELVFRMNTSVPLVLSPEFSNDDEFTVEWTSASSVAIQTGTRVWDASQGRKFTVRNSSESPALRRLNEHISEANGTFLSLIHMLDPNTIHHPYAERLWHELVKDRRDIKVVQMLNEIYRTNIQVISFMPFPDQTRMVALVPNTGLAVDWQGDGFRYAVNILALGVFLKGTALLVEELETHQHPESLKMLTQTLVTLAKEQDLQLFLTTHSMELITYALDAAEEKGIDLKLHHLMLDQEGSLQAIPLAQPNARVLMDMGIDPRLHYRYVGAK